MGFVDSYGPWQSPSAFVMRRRGRRRSVRASMAACSWTKGRDLAQVRSSKRKGDEHALRRDPADSTLPCIPGIALHSRKSPAAPSRRTGKVDCFASTIDRVPWQKSSNGSRPISRPRPSSRSDRDCSPRSIRSPRRSRARIRARRAPEGHSCHRGSRSRR
jgi:hypothetical protein